MTDTDIDSDIVIVDKLRVYCQGGPSPSLGHPRIYLNLGADGENNAKAICPYCGRVFRFAQPAQSA